MRYLFILSTFLSLLFYSCDFQSSELEENLVRDTLVIEPIKVSLFDINIDDFTISREIIKANEFLSDILLRYNVPYSKIHELAMASKEVYDVRRLERGKPYTIFQSKDSTEQAIYFVYQPNTIDYVVYDLSGDSVLIRMGQKEVTIVEREVQGVIKSSLYEALQDADQNVLLAFEMADIFAWTIDFYRLQKEDAFKVIYHEKVVEGQSIGVDRVMAILFKHEGKDFYAYYFEEDSLHADYYDEAAESLRKAFLKSPLKFSRMTSGYTMKRFHPVQKRWKSHLGTDYAAPRGTPILSTGDGKVVEARYKQYNGNYVKIKHNSVYMTQYLHMNKIEKGIKPGVYVKQGEVIGYVGSTGLATGPHVCYRFWKYGEQVNHLKEDFPPSQPVKEENMKAYYDYILPYQGRLNADAIKSS